MNKKSCMKLLKDRNIQDTFILFFLAVIFVALLIPLIEASFFSFPAEDDWGAMAEIYHMINKHDTIFTILKYIMKTTISMWENWQGSYFSVYVGLLIGGVTGYKYYYIGILIILFFYLIGNLILTKVVMVNICRCSNAKAYSISLLIMLLQINLMPSIVEGIYWQSGAVRYTLFYGVALIYIAMVIHLDFIQNTKFKKVLDTGCIVYSFIIGGVNLITSLQCVILTTLFSVMCIHSKKSNRKSILLNNVVLLISFMISALAPGNAKRSASASEHFSPIRAIIESFVSAHLYAKEWINIFVIIALLLGTIIFSTIVKNMNYKFKHPFCVVFFAYGMYASTYTPVLYGTGNSFPGRVLNIAYFNFIIFIFASTFYLTGWILNNVKISPNNTVSIIGVCILLFLLTSEVRGDSGMVLWGKEALKENREGELQQYKEEQEQRIRLYLDKENKRIEVEPFNVNPRILYIDDIRNDSNYWTNIGLAEYWEKESIVVRE